MERTLVLLKPDCIEKGNCGNVIARFEEAGFRIVACKMLTLTPKLLREHYAHIADKPFYPTVEKFMQRTPVIVMVLEGDGIIDRMREMLGVTDCREAAPGTIRDMYGSKAEGESKMVNVVHASDSPQTAEAEIARFFSDGEMHSY